MGAGDFAEDFQDGVLAPAWLVERNGCTVVETSGALHITGTSQQTPWAGNGVHTGFLFPAGDFTVSVDFKVPTFSGSGGPPLTYLQVASESGNTVGLFYDYPYQGALGYRVQAWSDPQQFSSWLSRFGDEKTAFHRMRLEYRASSKTVTGWVDSRLVGSLVLTSPMAGRLDYWLEAVTDRAGMAIDLYYDNFHVAPGMLPPPAPAFPDNGVSVSNGVPVLTFATEAGYRYRLLSSESLADSSWLPVPALPDFPPPAGWGPRSTGAPIRIEDPGAVGGAMRWYRIEASVP
jgi:hypothetical protein